MTSDPRVEAVRTVIEYWVETSDAILKEMPREILAAADRAALEGAPELEWIEQAIDRHRNLHTGPANLVYYKHEDQQTEDDLRKAAATLTAQAAEIVTLTRLLEQYRTDDTVDAQAAEITRLKSRVRELLREKWDAPGFLTGGLKGPDSA